MEEASLSPPHNTDVVPSSTFAQTWSPGAANAFDTSNLPVAKAHKAWERRPQAPRSTAAKYKKVWRTYGQRSNDRDHETSDVESENHRARAVKRMCVNESTPLVLQTVSSKGRKNYAGTKFDRRKSGIIRKTRPLRDMTPTGDADDEPAANQPPTATSEDDHDAEQSAKPGGEVSSKRVLHANRKRRSLGRHSLGANRGIRYSFGGSMIGSIAEEPAQETMAALCLSPRKKAVVTVPPQDDTPAEATVDEEAVAEPPREDAPEVDEETAEPATAEDPLLSPDSSEESPTPPMQDLPEELEPQVRIEPIEKNQEELVAEADEVIAPPLNVPDEDATEDMILAPDADDTKVEVAEEDTTSHWADETTTHLELDTALLKDFLSRTAAAKATRLESGRRISLPRRASLQNRRDSDAVRMALASPRKPLDDKDPNSPATSPAKMMDLPGVKGLAAQLDAITGGPLGNRFAEGIADDDEDTTISGVGSRRSARQRSRLPSLLNEQKTPNKISVKRTDGSDPVVVKKTEAQELSVLTRSNTRRNKGTSQTRLARLKKLKFEGMAESWTEGKVKEMAAMNAREDSVGGIAQNPEDQEQTWKIPAAGEKGVRWRDKEDLLTFFGGAPGMDAASDMSPEDATPKIPPPSSLNALSASALSAQLDIDSPRKKSNPARVRRLRGLGTTNGTPGKGLLASASLLPDEVAEEKEKSKVAAPKERRSRIAAPTPKKLKLTMKGEDSVPSLLKAPEVSVPKSLSMPAGPTSLSGSESKEVAEARERRLASPRKIPQFASNHAAPSAGTRRRRM